MPIRTHRGRAAVYRRLWGWPLRSPKHLLGVVLGAAAVATVIGLALPNSPNPPDGRSPHARAASASRAANPPSPAPSTHRPSPPTFSVPPGPPPPAPPSPQALATVRSWGRAWVHHPPGTTSQEWLNGLRPYTTGEYLAEMSSIDPANVPGKHMTGPATPVSSTASAVVAKLPTDGGELRVTAVSTPQGWRVSKYDKAA